MRKLTGYEVIGKEELGVYTVLHFDDGSTAGQLVPGALTAAELDAAIASAAARITAQDDRPAPQIDGLIGTFRTV